MLKIVLSLYPKLKVMTEYKLSNGNTLQVINDKSPESPRTWDNLGKMVCFHRRYDLGDKHDFKKGDYNSWDELKAAILKKENVAVIQPMYMYDHSGITVSTKPFSCSWDSGQIGFIYITKEAAREGFMVKNVTAKIKERLLVNLNGEVETYDQYLTGDIYGFKEVDSEGNEVDSCWGFYGDNPKTNGMSDHIDSEVLDEIK